MPAYSGHRHEELDGASLELALTPLVACLSPFRDLKG